MSDTSIKRANLNQMAPKTREIEFKNSSDLNNNASNVITECEITKDFLLKDILNFWQEDTIFEKFACNLHHLIKNSVCNENDDVMTNLLFAGRNILNFLIKISELNKNYAIFNNPMYYPLWFDINNKFTDILKTFNKNYMTKMITNDFILVLLNDLDNFLQFIYKQINNF